MLETTDVKYTSHSKQQMQRRGLFPLLPELLRYASKARALDGAFYYWFTRKEINRAIKDGNISPQEGDRILNTYYVVNANVLMLTVITIFKQNGGIEKIRRIQRAKGRRKRRS